VSVERRDIVDDVAEYTLLVQVGAGVHDRIGVHRVVRERAPWTPIAARDNLFMQSGDAFGFDAQFLESKNAGSVPVGHSLAVYLARRNVDVWGMDARWVLVPAETTSFEMMKDWDMGLFASDMGLALKVARAYRGLTGSGLGQMLALGFSRGVGGLYALANAETQTPRWLRDLRGMVAVDEFHKLAPEEERIHAGACARYAALQAKIDAGIYVNNIGQLASAIGSLATYAPEEPSTLVPGLSNYQAALLGAGATYLFLGPFPYVPSYHFNGALFDDAGVPTGLGFSDPALVIATLRDASPYMTLALERDSEVLWCNEQDSPYDDHLGEITIPVLYVGAGGAFGQSGVYTTTLVGSTDVTVNVVGFYPPEARAIDFGHLDLLVGKEAPTLVWEPLYDWVHAH
jgi:hypothetical protein